MTDINDTTGKFGNYINNEIYKEKKINKFNKYNSSENIEGTETQKQIQDTGVLGRSQVHSGKGADISKSVNEAVLIAQCSPAVLKGCQKIFETLYEQYKKEGLSDEEAYQKALLGEDEFMQIVSSKVH